MRDLEYTEVKNDAPEGKGGGMVEMASTQWSKAEGLVEEVGGVGRKEGQAHGDLEIQSLGQTQEAGPPLFLPSTTPASRRVGWVGSPAAPPQAERRSLCSSDMICTRQTFEVPDICIMWASLSNGNSCLAFPRLNCNYTRSLPGEGRREGQTLLLVFSNSFSFIHFLPPKRLDSGWARLFHPCLYHGC